MHWPTRDVGREAIKARAFSSFLRGLSRVGQAFESDEAADLLRELASKLDALKGNPTVASATRQLASADAGPAVRSRRTAAPDLNSAQYG